MDEAYREERGNLRPRACCSASSDPITGVHVTNGQSEPWLTDRLWGGGWPYFNMQGRDLSAGRGHV